MLAAKALVRLHISQWSSGPLMLKNGITTSSSCTGSLILYLLVSSVDNLCKQFGSRSGPTKCRAWSGSKLFDTDGIPEKMIMKKISRRPKKIKNYPVGKELKESAIHRSRWYNLKDYILERICKQRNCLKSIYSINYRYFKFTKFALESAWGSRHVFTPVTSLTHIDFLVGLPCARSACVLTKLAVHLYWNFDLISEKNSSSVW